ncbi:MAG: FecR domain-containing protein [Candidatus Cloacimonetes bacterium]|nr:FecR domain-containing protein [Candidatus Cloacimonadota bacterium]
MAKKWQDVEFVDYKERQRRKRMRKRQNVQKDIVEEVEKKWNFMIIGALGSAFLIILLIGLNSFFAEQSVSQDAKVKSYLESVQFTGDTFYRKLAGDDWVHFVDPKKFYDSWQFKTGVDSSLQLQTFDDVLLKLRSDSELELSSIEIFNDNKGSKTNIETELGLFVFDSSRSKGLLEIKVGSAVIYARPSKMIVDYQATKTVIKLGSGISKLSYQDSEIVLNDGEMIEISNNVLGEKSKFNPLSEKW